MPLASMENVADRTESAVSIGGEAARRAQARARKAGLLAEAARQFCNISRPTVQDLSIFKELFYQLVDGTDAGERRTLSATLCRNPFTPRTILIFLALDEPDIAAPVLMFAEALNEVDLSGVIERVSGAHLEILCRRNVLTEATVRRLIAKGGERCREILAKNLALRSNEGVQSILASANVQAPRRFVAPAQPVRPARPDRPAAPAAPIRAQLKETPAVAAPALGRTQTDLLAAAARGGQLGQRRSALRPPEPAAEGSRYDPALPFERQALRTARLKSPEAFATLANGFCGVGVPATLGILREGGPQSICVLLKGLGLSDLGALQCLLQIDPSVSRTMLAYNDAKQTLGRLQPATCRRFVEGLGARFAADREPGVAAPVAKPGLRRREEPAAAPAAPPPRPATPATPQRRSLLRA